MNSEDVQSARFVSRFLLGALALIFLPLAAIGIVAILDDDSGAASAPATTELDVTLSEFAIDGNLHAPEGRVTLAVTNSGSAEHNLVLEGGPSTPTIAPGASEQLDLGELTAGDYTLFC
jgi:manganese oxidase